MEFELEAAEEALKRVKVESRASEQMIADNSGIPNPVNTEGLTEMMFGAPGTVYNGGLMRATVRYHDAKAGRPGLPPDVSALVDKLGADTVGFQLVNLNRDEERRVIVQAGAFGEHRFTSATADGSTKALDSKYFEILLPAGSSIAVECGLDRFANQPSYEMPVM